MRHVNFCAQCDATVLKFACTHPRQEIQTFFYWAVAPGAILAGFGQGATVFAGFIRAEFIHISFAFFDEFDCPFIQLLKVIRSVKLAVFPVKSEPPDICFDGVNVFNIFFDGVGVIKPQVGFATIVLGDTKIKHDGFGMTDVKIPIGFRREACVHAPVKAADAIVFINDICNKVRSFWRFVCHFSLL